MKLSRLITSALACALLAALAYGLYWYAWVNEQLRGEYETSTVVQMIEEYVSTHNGRWPKSWDDLEATDGFKQRGMSSVYVRKYTVVDYSLTSEQLLRDPALIYGAVRPPSDTYICYPHARSDAERLMEVIRNSNAAPAGGPD